MNIHTYDDNNTTVLKLAEQAQQEYKKMAKEGFREARRNRNMAFVSCFTANVLGCGYFTAKGIASYITAKKFQDMRFNPNTDFTDNSLTVVTNESDFTVDPQGQPKPSGPGGPPKLSDRKPSSQGGPQGPQSPYAFPGEPSVECLKNLPKDICEANTQEEARAAFLNELKKKGVDIKKMGLDQKKNKSGFTAEQKVVTDEQLAKLEAEAIKNAKAMGLDMSGFQASGSGSGSGSGSASSGAGNNIDLSKSPFSKKGDGEGSAEDGEGSKKGKDNKRLLAHLFDEKLKNGEKAFAEDKTVRVGNDLVGAKMDNIFEMVHRRHKKLDEGGSFLID